MEASTKKRVELIPTNALDVAIPIKSVPILTANRSVVEISKLGESAAVVAARSVPPTETRLN